MIGVVAVIVLAGFITNEPYSQQNYTEIQLGNILPAKYSYMESVTSYWADARHIICGFQGYAGQRQNSPFARRGLVYEIPSQHVERFPILDSQPAAHAIPNLQAWDFSGLSKDNTRFFAHSEGQWYDTPAPSLTSLTTTPSLKWTQFEGDDPINRGILPRSHEVIPPTSAKLPATTEFANFVSDRSRSISPSGLRMAWIDWNNSPEQFARLRYLLRRCKVLSNRPGYMLWVSDINGNHKRRVALFGQRTLESFDLRWSPDEKHISCAEVMWSDSTPNALNVTTEHWLTVFDLDR